MEKKPPQNSKTHACDLQTRPQTTTNYSSSTHCPTRHSTRNQCLPSIQPSCRRIFPRKGTMDVRMGLLFLFVLSAAWACDARQLENSDLSDRSAVISEISVTQINYLGHEMENLASEQVSRNEVCTLCEEYAAKAIDYLNQNKTQTEIVDILHESCSRVATFKQKCLTLVDYYAPLFFLEISSIQAADFCQKFKLCEFVVTTSLQLREDSCVVCHRAVSEVLIKLKDPDTQLDIIELLLKGCNSVQKYVKKCKRLVFEYGPLMLVNAEQFLETTDVCTVLHACGSSTSSSKQASSVEKFSALSDS